MNIKFANPSSALHFHRLAFPTTALQISNPFLFNSLSLYWLCCICEYRGWFTNIGNYLLVVFRQDLLHVWAGSVADLVPIEDLGHDAAPGKAAVDQRQKLCTDVGLHVDGVRWVPKDHLSSSSPLRAGWWGRVLLAGLRVADGRGGLLYL